MDKAEVRFEELGDRLDKGIGIQDCYLTKTRTELAGWLMFLVMKSSGFR